MKRRDFLKATLWTESVRVDVEGRPVPAMLDLFITLRADQQQELFKLLRAHLQRGSEREGTPCPDTPVVK